MKKKILMILMALLVVFTYAESYEYNGDIWDYKDFTKVANFKGTFWKFDLENSEWTGSSPEELGLKGVVLSIGKDLSDNTIKLSLAYMTTKEYNLPAFIIVTNNEENDLYMIGGQYSQGDTSFINKNKNGYYYPTIVINLSKDDIKYLQNNNVYFYVVELNNGKSLYFGIPKEVFNTSFKNIEI